MKLTLIVLGVAAFQLASSIFMGKLIRAGQSARPVRFAREQTLHLRYRSSR